LRDDRDVVQPETRLSVRRVSHHDYGLRPGPEGARGADQGLSPDLDKNFRPPEAYAQWASATVLRDTYLTFAMWTSLISVTMWVLALFFSLVGTTSTLAMDDASRPPVVHAPQAVQSQAMDTTTPAPKRRRPPPSIRYQVFD
jgi:hypothetical protein